MMSTKKEPSFLIKPNEGSGRRGKLPLRWEYRAEDSAKEGNIHGYRSLDIALEVVLEQRDLGALLSWSLHCWEIIIIR